MTILLRAAAEVPQQKPFTLWGASTRDALIDPDELEFSVSVNADADDNPDAHVLETGVHQSPEVQSPAGKGVLLFLEILDVGQKGSGDAAVNCHLEQRHPGVPDLWFPIPGASFPNITAPIAKPLVLKIYPGLTASAGDFETVSSDVLPAIWRAVLTLGGTERTYAVNLGGYILP
jgi:hypothetical protein